MIKRIIVGLDGSRFSETATEFACREARTGKSAVVGMGIVDLPGIESVERGAPLGALYFAEKAEEHKLKDAMEKVQQFLGDFELTCKKFKVRYEAHTEQGDPSELIVEAGKTADLIVAGLRTYFRFETTTQPDDTLKRILEHSVCPIIAVPETMDIIKNILIAYDGTPQSARAMTTFMNRLFHDRRSVKVSVITIPEHHVDVEKIRNQVVNYLRCWDIEPTMILGKGKASETIEQHAKEIGNCLVVMGAHSRGSIAEFIFGSAARRLIEDGTIPLMIYH